MSKITYIDGLKGVLRHRGYAIEELADKSDFLETAYLLVFRHVKCAYPDLRRTPYKGARFAIQTGSHVTYLHCR